MIKEKLYDKVKVLLEVYSLREIFTKLQINIKIGYFYSILTPEQQIEIDNILNKKKNLSKKLKRLRDRNSQPINFTSDIDNSVVDALLGAFPPAINTDLNIQWINVNEITTHLCNLGLETNMVHVGRAIKQLNYINKYKKINNSKLKVYGIKN